jgi:DNA polymerase-3 subunit alpha
VLPPDINESQLHFSVEPGKGVRFGLTAIKGLGETAVNAILEARTQLGRIPSLHALCEILDLRVANKRVFEALVKSGACDAILGTGTPSPALIPSLRARLFAAIDGACEHGARTQRNKEFGQGDLDLFGGGEGASGPTSIPLPDVPPWSEIEQLNFEKETLGLYWSGHPIDRFADDLRAYGARTTRDLIVKREAVEIVPGGDASEDEPGAAAMPNQPPAPAAAASESRPVAEDISIGGIVSGLRPLKTRKGDRMCVFMLDDAGGSIEVVVFPEAFKQYGHLAENGTMVCVAGRFERDDESARIIAAEIVAIELVRERLTKSVSINVSMPPHDRSTFEKLLDVLAQHKGDRKVAFVIHEQERHLRVTADVSGLRVRPSERLVLDVEKICGAGSVSLR